MSFIFNHPAQKNLRRLLRRNMPPAELILWSHLRGKQLYNYKFRRQYGVGRFVLDFYCAAARLGIEIDGDSHFFPGAEEYDKARQRYIESHRIRILRFTNTDVYENINGVLEEIVYSLLYE